MGIRNTPKAAAPDEKRSAASASLVMFTADPAGTRTNTNNADHSDVVCCRQAVGKRSASSSESVTVLIAAELENISIRTVRARCANGKYKDAEKQPGNGGEGWLIPITSLPKAAQKAYAKKHAAELVKRNGVKESTQLPAVAQPADRHAEYQQMWDAYDRKEDNFKRMAESALAILQAYWQYIKDGKNIGQAEQALKASHGVSRATIRRYLDRTKHHPEYHWLPLLCPQYHGGRERAEFTPEAYDFILAARIKAPQCKLRVLIREAKSAGRRLNWVFPNEDTIAKRLKEEPAHLFLSDKELERSFPVIERNFNMEVHDMWETDGRKADVWCIWPDGTTARPFVIVYREMRSRYVLSFRICLAPDTEAAAGAFGTACRNAQAVPKYMKVDNGREYDNHTLTAGQSNRYRKTFRADVADGLWKSMGIVAKFSKPANGRDKPIESFWNVIAENVDRLPIFAGAYCGKDVASKPDDFHRDNAKPVELYAALLYRAIYGDEADSEFKGYHDRAHRGQNMNRCTPRQVYEDGTARVDTRKPTESELRKCRMAMTTISLDKTEASFKFKMKGFAQQTKYSAPELLRLTSAQRHAKFAVYYDYGEPNAPVSVWQNGGFICDAYPERRVDFIEEGAKQTAEHMEAKNKYIAAVKRMKKEIVKAGGDAASYFNIISTLTLPMQGDPLIAPSSKPQAVPVPASPIQDDPDRPGERINTETGARYIGYDAQLERERQEQFAAEEMERETAKRLERLRQQQEESRESAYLQG